MDASPPALDLRRRFAWLGLLLCGSVCGQPLPVDESKLPDWVKRQAAMPYRVIIQSPTATSPAAAPPAAVRKPTGTPLPAKKAVAAPSGTATTVAEPREAAEPAIDVTTTPAAIAAPPETEPLAAASPATTADPAAAPAAPPALTLIRRVDPTVPNELLGSLDSDKLVTVAFTVQPDGEVSDAQVVASTSPQLNRPVLRAIKSWRYAPIPQPRQHSVNFAFVAP